MVSKLQTSIPRKALLFFHQRQSLLHQCDFLRNGQDLLFYSSQGCDKWIQVLNKVKEEPHQGSAGRRVKQFRTSLGMLVTWLPSLLDMKVI